MIARLKSSTIAVTLVLLLSVLLLSGCFHEDDDDGSSGGDDVTIIDDPVPSEDEGQDEDIVQLSPPDLDPIGNKIVPLGSSLAFDVTASDPDEDPLAFSVLPLPLPQNASFNSSTGQFSFRPSVDQVEEFTLTFSVDDGTHKTSETITISVTGPTGITALTGRVLDANDFTQGTQTPVAGATISLLDSGLSVTTDQEGHFTLSDIPAAGAQLFDIDSSTVTGGIAYAGFRENIELIEGVNNVVDRPFYLPRIDSSSITMVDPAATTIVQNTSANVTLTLPPGTAKNEDGSDYTGELSISVVPEALAPAPLPEAFSPGMLITIQPVGVRFDPPAPITFPNIDQLPPGSIVDIWSLDPATGEFIIVATGQVNEAGDLIETISGGVIAADWHFPSNAPPQTNSNVTDQNGENIDTTKSTDTCVGSSANLQNGCLTVSHQLASYRSLGQDRALQFIYSSQSANPAPIINAQTSLASTTAVPEAFSAALTEVGGMALDDIQFISATSEEIRHAVQFDARAFPTGQYPYRLDLTSHYAASAVATISLDFLLVSNEMQSPFGAGWTLAGLQRIHTQAGQDRVTITEGNGTVKSFIPQGAVSGGTKTDLAFAIDGSGSIVASDFQLQLEGIASAVEDPLIIPHDGSVALAIIQFANSRANIEIGLTPIDSDETAEALAASIRTISQMRWDTPIDQGVLAAVEAIGEGTEGARQVICLSTDGTPNSEIAALDAADDAIVNGIDEISAIGIGAGANLDFLEDFVRNGAVFSAATFTEFSQSIGEKLRQIVGGSPAGDFSVLTRADDGSFTRQLKDGTRILFDQSGLQTAVIDRNGNTTSFAYDGQDRLITITDPVDKVTSLSYGADGLLEQVTDPAGRVTGFSHDADGNLVQITDPDSTSRDFSYDANHLLTTQTDKRGNLTEYFYTAENRFLESKRADDSIRKLTASATIALVADPASTSEDNPADYTPVEDAVSSYTNGNGNISTHITDRFGGLLSSTDPVGRTTLYERDVNGLATRITRPNDSVVVNIYDQRGNLISSTEESIGATISYSYEPTFNQVTSITDQDEFVTTFSYDIQGNLTAITDARDNSTNYTYNSAGQVLTATDARGNVTTFTYNTDGNLETITDDLNNISRIEYDSAGNVMRTVDAGGHETSFAYDELNRRVSRTDPSGAITGFTYDEAGNLIRSESPTAEVSTVSYDELNRIKEISDPARGTIKFTYDGSGNIIKTEDSVGAITELSYDDANQLTEIINALGDRESRSYNSLGQIASVTDPSGNVTGFAYDDLGRLILQEDPAGSFTSFTYDKRNNVTTLKNRRNQTITNVYDELSRLTSTITPDNNISFAYDNVGNLTSFSDSDSQSQLTYDDLNRLETVRTLGAQPDVTLTLAYDDEGNRISLADSFGGTVQYGYNNRDLLNELTTAANEIIDLDYDPAGRLQEIIYPNGLAADYSYDSSGRLSTLTHGTASTKIVDLAYGYNAVGSINSIVEPSGAQNIAYDLLQQLTESGAPSLPENYDYDEVGNRLASHLSGDHDHGDVNRLLQDDAFDYEYDADGNLTRKTDRTSGEVTDYSWDAQGQLVQATVDGTTTTYRYDAIGRRIEKNVDGTVTRYVYDGADIALELDGSNALVARYTHGSLVDQPLALERAGESYFYHADHLGSIRAITDSTGAAVNDYTYDAFGNSIAATEAIANPYRFTGREYDAESGMHYYRARYYDPDSGRFISEDPIGFAAGDTNLYRYVFNNPQNFTDPSGEFLDTILDLGFILYDIVVILNDNVFGDCDNLDTNLAALGADVAGAATPFATGGGLAVRAGAEVGSKAATKIDDVADVANSAAQRVVANGARGRASEARVLNDLGLSKNTQKVSSSEGNSIPDALTDSLSVEIKDAKNVSLTKQLRIQTESARASGRQSVLITGENTCVSGACQRAFDQVIRRTDLGPQ